MSETQIVYAWPDGTWVTSEEYSETEYGFKSDDFAIISLPPDYTDQEIDLYVDGYFN